jgi:hypothetical protein
VLLTEIKTAIYDFLYIQANAFKTALPGGLHYVENDEKKPQNIVYPYGVYSFVTGTYERDTGTKFENPIVQIDIYDNQSNADRASDVGEKLDARFDDSESSITMTNYYVLGVDRISPPRETKTFMRRWHHSRDYKIQLQKK